MARWQVFLQGSHGQYNMHMERYSTHQPLVKHAPAPLPPAGTAATDRATGTRNHGLQVGTQGPRPPWNPVQTSPTAGTASLWDPALQSRFITKTREDTLPHRGSCMTFLGAPAQVSVTRMWVHSVLEPQNGTPATTWGHLENPQGEKEASHRTRVTAPLMRTVRSGPDCGGTLERDQSVRRAGPTVGIH